MASVISIAIAARSTAAAALARTRAQIASTSSAIQRSSFVNRQHTRTVVELVGVYRDASGQWYDARGNMVRSAYVIRTTTTAYGRLMDAIQRTTRALVAYTIASRLARAASDSAAGMITRFGIAFGLLAVKAVAAMAVLFPLVGVIGNLIPLVMLIVPAAATAGLAMVGLKLAFNGVKEALDAGLSGDTEAFEKALKKLAPSAANAVRSIVKLRDTWKPLAKDFQNRVFEGAAGEIDALSAIIKPIADRWLPKLAMRFAEVRHQLANGLASFSADGRLEAVWRNLHAAASAFLSTIFPIARVLGDIVEVAAPRFAALADTIAILVQRFSDWIRASRDNGNLQKWLDKAMETFGKLKDIAVNVGRIIGAIFKASGNEGDDMLDQIVRATEKMADWANGGDGQMIINIISKIVQFLGQAAPVFEAWSTWFGGVVIIVKAAWDGISAVFRAAIGLWISYLGGMVVAAAKAFGWIPGIGPKLKQAAAEFEEYKNRVNRSLDGIQDEVVNITYRSQMIGNVRVSGAQLSGSYSSGIGGRHSGGPGGSPKQTNEWGHEIVDFTKGMVYNSNETKRAREAMAAGVGARAGGPVVLRTDAAPGSMGAAVASLLNMAIRGGQLTLRVDPSGRVTGAA